MTAMSCVHGIVVGFSVCVNDDDLKFRILDLREKPAMAQGSRFSRDVDTGGSQLPPVLC